MYLNVIVILQYVLIRYWYNNHWQFAYINGITIEHQRGILPLETFSTLKEIIDNPHYLEQREKYLNLLDITIID